MSTTIHTSAMACYWDCLCFFHDENTRRLLQNGNHSLHCPFVNDLCGKSAFGPHTGCDRPRGMHLMLRVNVMSNRRFKDLKGFVVMKPDTPFDQSAFTTVFRSPFFREINVGRYSPMGHKMTYRQSNTESKALWSPPQQAQRFGSW